MKEARLLALSCAAIVALAAAASAAGPSSPADDGTMPALAAIAGRAMMSTQPYSELEYLTDRIGARLTGSEGARRAAAWAAERMKAAGLTNVHTESFDVKRGWSRGGAELLISSPIRRTLPVASFGWAGSTLPGGVEAELVAVDLGSFAGDEKAAIGDVAGKVLFLRIGAGISPRAYMLDALVKAAESARVAAILLGPFRGATAGMQLVHTSSPRDYTPVPIASTSAEGYAMIGRLLGGGEKVRVRLNVQNRVTDGPVTSSNVVGEIPGTEKAGEIVLVGAHLDSWDLADGATDNGFGAAAVLGAAEAIAGCGFRPRRTIRFVLFTGEEQGFLGSIAYTKAHRAELAGYVAAFVLDSGQGPVATFNLDGREDLIPAFAPFTRAVRSLGDIQLDTKTEFGTDTLPFTVSGIPGINLDQDSPEYDHTHHSAADTFDKVRAEYLLRDTAVLALVSYWVAARPERIATPWPPEKTARMLIDLHEDRQLKLFGLWPFDDSEVAPADKPLPSPPAPSPPAGKASALSTRPASWAASVEGSHVPNLYRIEADLYRSAQPDAAGFQELASLGIKTVLDLRSADLDDEPVGTASLRVLSVPMHAWNARDADVLKSLRILTDRSNRPILVHCLNGADRTGMIVALYRVVVQGWSKDDALKEMNDGGYHHSSWFRNLDQYVRNADVASLRRELGIPGNQPHP